MATVTSADLREKRAGVEQRLGELRQKRVDAMLEGKTFDDKGEIARGTAELELIDEAIAEACRREKEAREAELAAAQAAEEAAREKRLEDGISGYLEIVAEIEKQADGFADSLIAGVSKIESLSDLPQQFGMEPTANHGLSRDLVMNRLADRFLRALSKRIGTHGSFGRIRWMPEAVRDEDWVEEERREMKSVESGLFNHKAFLARQAARG